MFKLDAALVRAGLIRLKAERETLQSSGIASWTAQSWPAGGSAAIILRDPTDAAARAKVRQVLAALQAEAANGIASILEPPEIAKVGGSPTAAFWVDLHPGFATGTALEGPLIIPTARQGTHGYSPTHPEMGSSFFMAGAGIRKGVNLGPIDMRSIAPTLARLLGAVLPSADQPPLPVAIERPKTTR